MIAGEINIPAEFLEDETDGMTVRLKSTHPVQFDSNSVILFTLRYRSTRGPIALTLSSANAEIVVTDVSEKEFALPKRVLSISTHGPHVYDFKVVNNGDIPKTVLYGTWFIKDSVTRNDN